MSNRGNVVIVDWAKATANTDFHLNFNIAGSLSSGGANTYIGSNGGTTYNGLHGDVMMKSLAVPGHTLATSTRAGNRVDVRQPTITSDAIFVTVLSPFKHSAGSATAATATINGTADFSQVQIQMSEFDENGDATSPFNVTLRPLDPDFTLVSGAPAGLTVENQPAPPKSGPDSTGPIKPIKPIGPIENEPIGGGGSTPVG
jgi:hypothetical protein